LVQEGDFVDASDAQRLSLAAMRSAAAASLDEKASDSFEAGSSSTFVTSFASLASGSEEVVCEGGVSFKELADFVANAESSDRAKIVSRIAESKVVAEPKPETEQPAVQEETPATEEQTEQSKE
jgi:hypothetical protein